MTASPSAQALLQALPSGRKYTTFEGTAPRPGEEETYTKASWFSRLIFGYAQPVMDIGNKRQLNDDDLWQLEGENRTAIAFAKFKRAYLRHDKSVFRAILATYGMPLLICGLGSSTMAACAIFAPIVLQHVIDAFIAPELDLNNLLWWFGTFLASRLLNAFCDAHVDFNIQISMLHLTASLKSLLYEKVTRRSIQTKSANENDSAEVSNLFTGDIDSIYWASYEINLLWVLPIQIVAVVYMLYTVLDLAAFAGLGVIFLSMAAQSVIAKVMMGAYMKVMDFKDGRMRVVNEIFGAIQIVKLNAWEHKSFERIQEWRDKEMGALKKYWGTIVASGFFYWNTPLLVAIVSFVTYALVMKRELTAAKVFTAMVLFNSIRMPLFNISNVFQNVLQARVSIDRITKYLNDDEVHPERVARDVNNYPQDVMVSVENANFTWKTASQADVANADLVLRDVNFQVREGDFVVIHGPVGAGKSSLVAAILGELPRATGKVFVRTEKVAYYSQQPWIQHLTIRDNILFGLPFDAKKYERVIDACGLTKDLEQFPAGDMTEIGQKGVNLSGGQKARVSLARACYSDADIFILDSPLAAVDAVVQSEIFNKCLCGLLEKKTVLLATHLHDVIESEAVDMKISVSPEGVTSVTREERTQPRRAYAKMHVEKVSVDDDVTIDADTKQIKSSGMLIEEESREDGRVAKDVFMFYLNAIGGVKFAVMYVSIIIIRQAFLVSSDLWLSHWTGAESDSDLDSEVSGASVGYNVSIYALLGIGTMILSIMRSISFAVGSVRGSQVLFAAMTKSLLSAPLRFFDANPIGRIVNRYSEDMTNIDFNINMFGPVTQGVATVLQLATAIMVIRYLGLFFIPLVYVYIKIGAFYLNSSREVSRLLKVSTSPILNHLSQSDDGIAVIRAFGPSYVDRAIDEAFKRIDGNSRVWYAETLVNQWFAVRIQMIGFAVVVVIVSALLVLRDYLSPGLVGLAFMYAVNIDEELSNMVKTWSGLEVAMVSPERVSEYIGIPAEGSSKDSNQVIIPADLSPLWPKKGSIKFDNVVFAYKPGAEPVLKGLSFDIKPNENIGIVGRTGAGKSSLTMALFRINELESGRIVIDGQDISTINLHTLRSRMSIIPQVPVLFKGPLRAYMDPFNAYTDADIWQAFDKIGLKDMISALDGKLDHELSENGENFSVGERQMLCLARALLRQSRVVVMDEATASIDLATEQKLQSMIQREFVDATVLTIAHRLATVLDSDRILVLSDGRVVEFDTPKRLARVEGGVFRELAQESGHLTQLLQ
ncbi:hypothetical protein Poli38472_001288 [Pythium oligandrum]|uniref:P-loop containing nucleoside triphosphate hydrolase protein n=1 Tax=Pythium oligandrum TaxID=41045 RepID=A0A8K1CUK8_PYTOL|nr:hypothetical protein Poli38472_001288 [Pythium oligandrum]|eukprot:TMW69132.1 hypothetical protein Poli38472_001288 [Pythium oligandrum]